MKFYERNSNLQIDFTKLTALAKHSITSKHEFNWDASKIVTVEQDFFKRRFLESYFISNSSVALNDKVNELFPVIYHSLSDSPSVSNSDVSSG